MPTHEEVARIERAALEEYALHMAAHDRDDVADSVRYYSRTRLPAPPKRVRAEVALCGNTAKAVWQDDGDVAISLPSGRNMVYIHRRDIAMLAALDAKADAEGMVLEEGLGAEPTQEQAPDGGVNVTPAPSPAPAPEETREWWISETEDGFPLGVSLWKPNAAHCKRNFPVVPRAALESERRALAVYQRDAEETTRELAQIVCGENPDYVPRASLDAMRLQLADAQKERDKARASRDDWEKIALERAHTIATLRAQLAEATRDVTREEFEKMQGAVLEAYKAYGPNQELIARAALKALGKEVEGE